MLPDENFSLNVLVSYDSNILPNQFATLEDMTKFKDEIAASRTFVFVREIEPLLQAGLIKGGDLDNAIVIYEREMSQENYDKLADVMGVPHMDAKQLDISTTNLWCGPMNAPATSYLMSSVTWLDRQAHQGPYHRYPPGTHYQQ